jgi:hypothetical protein
MCKRRDARRNYLADSDSHDTEFAGMYYGEARPDTRAGTASDTSNATSNVALIELAQINHARCLPNRNPQKYVSVSV